MSYGQIVRKLASMELHQVGRVVENMAPWKNATRYDIVVLKMEALG